MVFRGHVRKGAVVFDGDVQLPEGTIVEIRILEDSQRSAADDAIYRIGELAESTGIPDLAENIDHYLYGHPKVDDREQ